MDNFKTDMKIKEPGFWARLIAVLRPLPPPLMTGICIGFEEEEDIEEKSLK